MFLFIIYHNVNCIDGRVTKTSPLISPVDAVPMCMCVVQENLDLCVTLWFLTTHLDCSMTYLNQN